MSEKKWSRKLKVDSSITDMWNFYKLNQKNPVDKKTYVNICYTINKLLAHAIITESFELKLPYRLGKIGIRTNKQKIYIKDGKLDVSKMPINWVATKAMWRDLYPELSWDKSWDVLSDELKNIPDKKLVIHTNEHNNGYINRWKWDKRLVNIPNNTAYNFKPVKGGFIDEKYYYGKRGLAAWVKNDERTNEYYE